MADVATDKMKTSLERRRTASTGDHDDNLHPELQVYRRHLGKKVQRLPLPSGAARHALTPDVIAGISYPAKDGFGTYLGRHRLMNA
jgi:hypothetical protein